MNVHRRRLSILMVLMIVACSLVPFSGAAMATQDVYIRTYTPAGDPIRSACYSLVGYSNVGCDDNHDGAVRFQQIPDGTYVVHYEGGVDGLLVDDFEIIVDGNVNTWSATGYPVTTHSPRDTTQNVRIISRDPSTGDMLRGACYRIGTYSLEGCDENLDGMVTFDAMPLGTYDLIQTRAPRGFALADAFPITIDNWPEFQTFTFSQQVRQPSHTATVSLLFLDSMTNARIENPGLCATIGTSNQGCDEDTIDGQIDFLDIPTGVTVVHVSSAPGYEAGFDQEVTVDAHGGRTVTIPVFLDRR